MVSSDPGPGICSGLHLCAQAHGPGRVFRWAFRACLTFPPMTRDSDPQGGLWGVALVLSREGCVHGGPARCGLCKPDRELALPPSVQNGIAWLMHFQ